jgi:hypothetical protein
MFILPLYGLATAQEAQGKYSINMTVDNRAKSQKSTAYCPGYRNLKHPATKGIVSAPMHRTT